MIRKILQWHPRTVLLLAALLIAIIALVDWKIVFEATLGFLYMFPMVLLGTIWGWWPLALTAAFAVLYPISLKHTLNVGSDREDALRIELNAVRHHQYPYGTHTFLGNPPTPLPGAMLLAALFFTIGHIAWQNFLWLALFFLFAVHFFR